MSKVTTEDVLAHLQKLSKQGLAAQANLINSLKDPEVFSDQLSDHGISALQICAQAEIARRLMAGLKAGRWTKLEDLRDYAVGELTRHLEALHGSQSTNILVAPKRVAQGCFWAELARVLSGLS